MSLVDSLFGKQQKRKAPASEMTSKQMEDFSEIGEIDNCPHCKRKLTTLPSRKKKCEFCGEYIYVRTRPIDRKKVLVTEKQAAEIEEQWNRHFQLQEEAKYASDPDYVKARHELANKFGKDPSVNDVKWLMFNGRLSRFASQRQWGLYRSTKFEMAQLLKKEGKLTAALDILFEVCYSDLCGCRNVPTGMSRNDLDRIDVKDCDSRFSFLAPGVIWEVNDLLSNLGMSKEEAKSRFIEINEKTWSMKDRPIPASEAWQRIVNEIKEDEEIQSLNAYELISISQKIEEYSAKKKFGRVAQIVNLLKTNYYRNQTKDVPNKEIGNLLKNLLNSEEPPIYQSAESLLVLLAKKEPDFYEPLVVGYLEFLEKTPERYYESHIIGELAEVNPKWIEQFIPKLIDTIKNANEWNHRRFAAFNLGRIGSKKPELIKEAIPIIIEYLRNPKKISKPEVPIKIKTNEVVVTARISLDFDESNWLTDAYLYALAQFAKGNPSIVSEYRLVIARLAETSNKEYTKKRAQEILELIK